MTATKFSEVYEVNIVVKEQLTRPWAILSNTDRTERVTHTALFPSLGVALAVVNKYLNVFDFSQLEILGRRDELGVIPIEVFNPSDYEGTDTPYITINEPTSIDGTAMEFETPMVYLEGHREWTEQSGLEKTLTEQAVITKKKLYTIEEVTE